MGSATPKLGVVIPMCGVATPRCWSCVVYACVCVEARFEDLELESCSSRAGDFWSSSAGGLKFMSLRR